MAENGKTKRPVVSFRMDGELLAAVDERAAKEGISRNAYVEAAVQAAVEGRVKPRRPEEVVALAKDPVMVARQARINAARERAPRKRRG